MDINIIVGNVAPPSGIPAQTQQKIGLLSYQCWQTHLLQKPFLLVGLSYPIIKTGHVRYSGHFLQLEVRRNRATVVLLMLVEAWKYFWPFLKYLLHSFLPVPMNFCFVQRRCFFKQIK